MIDQLCTKSAVMSNEKELATNEDLNIAFDIIESTIRTTLN